MLSTRQKNEAKHVSVLETNFALLLNQCVQYIGYAAFSADIAFFNQRRTTRTLAVFAAVILTFAQ